jgi:hypothetical protein
MMGQSLGGSSAREDPDEIVTLFHDISSMLTSHTGQVDSAKAVQLAAQLLPHTDHCGITLIRPKSPPRTIAFTDELPEAVDALQYRVREGPCLDAADTVAVVMADDLAADDRWPQFAPLCVARTGVRSMLGLRLAVRGGDRAGMNFYARRVKAFDELDVRVGSILATFAALAVELELHDRDTANLEAALRTNRQIGMAIGIVMATEKVTESDAFQLLRKASNHLNRKLVDIAEHVQLTGSPPGPPAHHRKEGNS